MCSVCGINSECIMIKCIHSIIAPVIDLSTLLEYLCIIDTFLMNSVANHDQLSNSTSSGSVFVILLFPARCVSRVPPVQREAEGLCRLQR